MKYVLSFCLGAIGLVLMGLGFSGGEADASQGTASFFSFSSLEWWLGAASFGVGFCLNLQNSPPCVRMRKMLGFGAVGLGVFFFGHAVIAGYRDLGPEDLFRQTFVFGLVGLTFIVAGSLMALVGTENEAQPGSDTGRNEPGRAASTGTGNHDRHDDCGCGT